MSIWIDNIKSILPKKSREINSILRTTISLILGLYSKVSVL